MEDRRKDDTKIDVLTERVNIWIDGSKEYRKALCAKIDIITEKISKLPCPQRIEVTRGIHTQLKALWLIVGAVLFGIIAEWLKLK